MVQYWALEHPHSTGYGERFSIPKENISTPDFIETAILKPNTNFVTRSTKPLYGMPGGGIEVVVPKDAVIMKGHSSFEVNK